ncbi:MAG TPA: multiheme c-type cytochrome, partial [Vicinamibacteria bacterium]
MTSHLGRFLIAGFLVLVVNSGYLAAFADASVFYAANVLLHVLLGVLLALLAIPLARRLLGGELTPLLWWVVAAAMAATVVTGLALVVLGNLRPMRPLLVAHIAISVVAALLVVIVASRRLATAVVLGAILFAGGAHYLATSETPSVNQDLPPATMAGESMGGENGPFFPSSARTEHGDLIPADFFMESATCGEAGCHPDIHDQWTSSAHRLASFNNQWYRKSVEYMQSVVGTEPSKWCGGCHDHAILFSGMMDTPIEEIVDRPEAHAGLGCVSCHSIVDVRSTMGNGGFVLEYAAIHDLVTSENR